MDLATCERVPAFGPITAASAGLGCIGSMNAAFGFGFDFLFAGAFFAFAFGFAAFFFSFFFAAILVLLTVRRRASMCVYRCLRRAKAKVSRASRNREIVFSLANQRFFTRISQRCEPRPLTPASDATRATRTSSLYSTAAE